MSKHMSKAEGAKLGITISSKPVGAVTRPIAGGTEYTFANETLARVARRDFIDAGKAVSLLSVDGRGYHVFDVYDS